jgi:uncharacterized protein YggT (Ycf19 family)
LRESGDLGEDGLAPPPPRLLLALDTLGLPARALFVPARAPVLALLSLFIAPLLGPFGALSLFGTVLDPSPLGLLVALLLLGLRDERFDHPLKRGLVDAVPLGIALSPIEIDCPFTRRHLR